MNVILSGGLAPLKKSSRIIIVLIALLLTIAIWAADYALFGQEVTFTLLYLIPITAVAWHVGRKPGIILSVVSTAGWFSVYLTQSPAFSYSLLTYLNLGTKLLIYLVFVFLLTALRAALRHERELSRTDFLTGAVNVRYFNEIVEREISRVRRSNQPITLVYMDIDNFKIVNDSFGHSAGDKLLRLTTETIRDHIRIIDTLARLGGDEFAILLPEQGLEPAKTATTKIQRYLMEMTEEHRWPVTFSFGVITCARPPRSPDELISLADALMYDAKQSGKNRIRYKVCAPADGEVVVSRKK